MRTFIAIELSDGIRDTLAQMQSHLKYAGADVKWVDKGNIHLTLKFLGEIDENKCEKVKASLDEIAKGFKRFEIDLKGLGAFPSLDFPRVIWCGLDKGAKESVELAERIGEAMSKLAFKDEARPFTAHLTIGRVRSSKNKSALREKIEKLIREPSAVSCQPINSIALFQSTLTPTGPIYTKLHEARLC
ncbi:MAG: RNA 2',3'-cyclic phosphodiesterase [Candidatus Omnitrophota bacterium]|nr:RNA 2',3'-cyclic phosphodiesterase [Candidatus Omnitrophota bacterium]